MGTHSVELDQDLTKTVVLVDEQGSEHLPVSWEGQIGGHHREGILIFEPINPFPSTIMLAMKNIAEVPERTFKWGVIQEI